MSFGVAELVESGEWSWRPRVGLRRAGTEGWLEGSLQEAAITERASERKR
jgi:hypothetical protein